LRSFLTGDNSGGKVRAMHVEKRTKKEMQSAIHEHVEAGSAIFSDELLSYDGLESDYQHQVINHAVEYVNGEVVLVFWTQKGAFLR
jgi:transposase-like protein